MILDDFPNLHALKCPWATKRMHKYFKLFFGFALFTIAIGTSSCFDIFEEYVFNADGSGKATMIVDVSKMVDMLDAFGSALDSAGDGSAKSMDEMFESNDAYNTLKTIPGIANLQNLNSKEKKQLGYSFEFKDIEALNASMIARGNDFGLGGAMGMGSDEDAESEKENTFALAGKKFSRKLDMKMDPTKSDDEEEQQYAEMAMMMFKDAKYNVKYSFERSVKKVKGNDAALVGADGKSVTIENNLKDLLDGNATMSSEIRLK